VLAKNKGLEGKTVGQIAKEQGKGIIDAFLDLVVEENPTPLSCTARTTSMTRRSRRF
jgi:N-acyl-D-aspartate/D-glutamate deacylase